MALEGFKFRRGDSPVHQLDPRAKFILSCAIFTIALLYLELPFLIILFLAQLPFVYVAGVIREWSRSVKGSLYLMTLVLLMNVVFGYISAGYRLTGGLLTYALSTSVRFLALVSSFSVFFLTTSPDDLGLALQQARIPYDFCFAFTTAVRFVPVLAEEAQTIMDSQKSRGLELEKGNIVNRIQRYIPILVPLIVGAIRRSMEMAEAMEARAFGAKEKRTSLYSLTMRRVDWIIVVSSLLFLLIAISARYMLDLSAFDFIIPL